MHHKFIDQYSHLDSFLHRLDPRVKIITFVVVICCIVSTPQSHLSSLCLYGMMVLFFIFISRLPLGFILQRFLIFLPFVFFLSLSVCLKAGSDRVEFFIFFLLRSFLSITCMVILVSTISFADLLKGFQKMRCPQLLLMIFSFMYRYLYLFSDQLMKMNRAREARSVVAGWWVTVKALSNMIGSLFIRSYERSEEVYLAMCSRGYRGQIRTIRPFVLKFCDYSFMAAVFVYVGGVFIWGFLNG